MRYENRKYLIRKNIYPKVDACKNAVHFSISLHNFLYFYFGFCFPFSWNFIYYGHIPLHPKMDAQYHKLLNGVFNNAMCFHYFCVSSAFHNGLQKKKSIRKKSPSEEKNIDKKLINQILRFSIFSYFHILDHTKKIEESWRIVRTFL